MDYNLIKKTQNLADSANELLAEIKTKSFAVDTVATTGGVDHFSFLITAFVLACFVGYYVVWKVTPALHTPLMALTNAVSSIIIIGAIIATGSKSLDASTILGFFAVLLASINIFGGFIITQKMLAMFKKKS
jgi:NAD(P) transhydrogenase subunit alpha